MTLKKFFQRVFLSGAFRIDLDEENTYECDKNFVFPTTDVLLSAIVKYAEKNGWKVEFISYDKPITFWITDRKPAKNTREKYRAELVKGTHHPWNLGYYVMCYKEL